MPDDNNSALKAPSIQIPKFSGLNEDASYWLSVFKKLHAIYKWEPAEALVRMSLAFDKTSLTWLDSLKANQTDTVEHILDAFKKHFISGTSSLFLETNFSKLSLKSDESYDSYYLRLKSEGLKINASDQRVISHFLNSLPQGAKNFVLAGDITSETNILEKARMYEQMTPKHQSKDTVNPVVDELKSEIPIDSSDDYYGQYYDNVNHISNQRGNFSARRGGMRSRGRGTGRGSYRNTDSNNVYTNPSAQNNYTRGRGGGPRGNFRSRGGRGRGSGTPQYDSTSTQSTKAKKCFACKGDHLIKECPFDPKNKKPKCYHCGLSTHMKNKCPFLRK